MRVILMILISLTIGSTNYAQNQPGAFDKTPQSEVKAPRKIIMQLTTSDTTVHKMLIKQINNILTVAPDSKIEVVCHGPGLSLLNSLKSLGGKQLEVLSAKGVDLVACQFSMKERNVTKEQLFPFVRIVEAGIIEIVDKQNEGWVYIKAG